MPEILDQLNAGRMPPPKEPRPDRVPDLHNPPDEGNDWEVTCIGTRGSLKVNGKSAWEITEFKARKGPLGIEAEGHAIAFRQLRIKVIGKKE